MDRSIAGVRLEERMRRNSFFLWTCLFEGALAGLAIGLGKFFRVPIWETLHWNPMHLAVSLAATLPLIGLLVWAVHSRWKALVDLYEFIRRHIRPWFREWSLARFAVVSLIAGFGEELLFRAFLQGGLSLAVGEIGGLLLASLVFGLAHWLTPAYGILATFIGLYLGALWQFSGNLLVVMIVHALYDFVALVYLFRYILNDSADERASRTDEDRKSRDQ